MRRALCRVMERPSGVFQRRTGKDPIKLAPVRVSANTMLFDACKSGDPDGVHRALALGASPTFRDQEGRVALHWAALYRHAAVMRVLLAHPGADLLLQDARGWRAIHHCCDVPHGMPRSVADNVAPLEVLVLRGENAGVPTEPGGDTPLMLAARFGLREIIAFLMNLPSAFLKAAEERGSAGLTASEIAHTWGFDDVSRLIDLKAAPATRR